MSSISQKDAHQTSKTYPHKNSKAIHTVNIKLDTDLTFGPVFQEQGRSGNLKLMVGVDGGCTILAAAGNIDISLFAYKVTSRHTLIRSKIVGRLDPRVYLGYTCLQVDVQKETIE